MAYPVPIKFSVSVYDGDAYEKKSVKNQNISQICKKRKTPFFRRMIKTKLNFKKMFQKNNVKKF